MKKHHPIRYWCAFLGWLDRIQGYPHRKKMQRIAMANQRRALEGIDLGYDTPTPHTDTPA